MSNFIPEEEYQGILKKMPIFCADYLITAEKKYLLINKILSLHLIIKSTQKTGTVFIIF